MRRAIALLAAAQALVPLPSFAQGEAPGRQGQVLLLRVAGDPDTHYAAYYLVPGERGSLVVQRTTGVLSGDDRVEVSASACPGLHQAIESIEQVQWPALTLGPGGAGPYLERGQFTAYVFHGALAYPEATSWETILNFLDVHGQPRSPFVRWAQELVRTVDTCLARQRQIATEAAHSRAPHQAVR